MSNIPYPDVPNLPGVPAVNRAGQAAIATGLAVAAELYQAYKNLKNIPPKYPKQKNNFAVWGILYDSDQKISYVNSAITVNTATITKTLSSTTTTGNTTNVQVRKLTGTYALEPDSFVKFEYKKDNKIPNYPIEQGSFQTYNKVALPYEVKLTITKNGSISPFIVKINELLNSTALLTIVTPDAIYKTTNLVHFDYRKEARNGAVLLIAELTFQEVRIAPNPAAPTAAPQGAKTTPLGQTSPLPVLTQFGTNIPVSGNVPY